MLPWPHMRVHVCWSLLIPQFWMYVCIIEQREEWWSFRAMGSIRNSFILHVTVVDNDS
jgi:hypothetical protein